jgi:bis(5'-nucleosidyl)-tetraphosphatase
MNKSLIIEEEYLNSPDIWSAGGVVIRNNNDSLEVLICERFSEKLVALPKGKPNKGENEPETALREVKEETGINVSIIKKIKDIFYSFKELESIITKKVSFFLMAQQGGNILDHDDEFDKVYWEQIDSALEKLTFQGEKDVLEEAIKLVKSA